MKKNDLLDYIDCQRITFTTYHILKEEILERRIKDMNTLISLLSILDRTLL